MPDRYCCLTMPEAEACSIIFRMDSGYFAERSIKPIEGAGYCYMIKAKQ